MHFLILLPLLNGMNSRLMFFQRTNPTGKANLQFGDYSLYKNCENKDASCPVDGKSTNSRKYCNIWILVVECLEQSSPQNCQNDLLSAAGVLKLNSRFLFSKRSSFKLHSIHGSFQPLVSIVVVLLNFVRFQQRGFFSLVGHLSLFFKKSD